jgi:hypothetical protein
MLRIFTLALLTSLSTALAFAQTTSSTTATVTGTVTDQQSGVLPGVTVSLSGPSMMGVQTQVSDSLGLYRFVSIPPGEYKLVFELAGFATVNREGVRLTPGFTATINTQMGVATLSENVQVTGESPIVDTQSTAINTTFDKETLANLPSARDYWAVLSESPGVKLARIDVGGSAAGTQTGYFVYGTTGQNRPMVEGINSTEATGSFGNYVDYGSFSEISIGSGATSAESPVPGVYTVLISKSGGNRYTGSFYGDYETLDWQAFNIDADQIAAGVSGGGGLEPQDTQSVDQLSRSQRRRRRVSAERQALVVRIGAKPRLGRPLHEFPGQATRDAPGKFHVEGHLSAVAEQQADRLLPAQHQGAEEPARPATARRHSRDPSHRRRQLPAGLQPFALEG